MTKLIVVVGVTGNQGSSVAEIFLKDKSWKVRGTTRNPNKPEAQALAAKGVEIVQADTYDSQSLKEAFKGANVIFGNTLFDIMPIVTPTEADRAALKPNQTFNELAFDREVEQGKNIADAVVTVGDSLELFIWSTLSDAQKWSNGKYKGVYHFDSKVAVVNYIHEKYPHVAEKMSFLQMGLFVTNWKWGPAAVPWQKRPDGSMLLRIPGSGDFPTPFILPSDAGLFAQALTKLPPGKNIIAYGDLLKWEDFVKLWSKVTGVPAKFEKATVADQDKIAPGGWGQEIGEMFAYMMDFGYWGGGDESVIFAKDLNVEPTRIEDYIRNEDWSELLNMPVAEQ